MPVQARRRRLVVSLVMMLTAFVSTGCGGPAVPAEPQAQAAELRSGRKQETPRAPEAGLAALTQGNIAFALDLYRVLRKEEGNLFFSPHSVSLALAMTYAGARSTTAQQMAQALHFDLPQERLHPAFNALNRELAARATARSNPGEEHTGFTLNQANAIWGQRGHHFEPAFLDLLAAHYGAGLRLADFAGAPEPSRTRINDWVREQTQNKIDKLFPPGSITASTRLALTNAIYFKAQWQHPFNKAETRDAAFTLLTGRQASVPTMHATDALPLPYASGTDVEAIQLNYFGDVSMVVLLPKPGQLGAFEAALSPERLRHIVEGLKVEHVKVAMPKFRYTSDSVSLKQTLQALGMADAFDAGAADFSGMDGAHNLFISDAFHKAMVAVDEAGTEAAAATGVAMAAAGFVDPPIEMKIDRPFIFLIRDNKTGALLFAGRIVDPRE